MSSEDVYLLEGARGALYVGSGDGSRLIPATYRTRRGFARDAADFTNFPDLIGPMRRAKATARLVPLARRTPTGKLLVVTRDGRAVAATCVVPGEVRAGRAAWRYLALDRLHGTWRGD